MTSFLNSVVGVFHLEPDLYIDGNILFSDGCALETTDWIATTTIAGHPKICDFYNCIGTLARFGQLYSFRQISPTEVVIADYHNHCLRLLNRITLQSSRYAGSCKSFGYTDSTSAEQFTRPKDIIDDFKHPAMLIVTDRNNIRHVNK